MIGELTVGKIATPAIRFTTNKVLNYFKDNRREKLLKCLETGKYTFDSPELQKDEFISCYLATEEAIFKSTSQSKLNALIAMFVNGVDSQKIFNESDKYQEVLSIVCDLSDRELALLYWLYQFEYEPVGTEKSDDIAVRQLEFLSVKVGIQIKLLKALLIRLKRTGLIISETDNSVEYTAGFITGFELLYLSELADEIKHWIMFTIDYENTNPFNIERDSL